MLHTDVAFNSFVELGSLGNDNVLDVLSPSRMGGNIMFAAQIIIFVCVILSNTLLEMPYK